MRKRTLRSVLVAVFSAVMAFGVLSGLAGAEGDVRADSSWGAIGTGKALPPDSSWGPVAPHATDDSSWG